MSSNTTDKFVPALKRHTFTAGGCSNGEHDQPVFNQGDHAGFSEEWEGYIYVPQEKECNIRVAADDNASFYLEAFPDKVAKLEARGPQGGGHYEYCDTVNLGVLAKGYYRARVSYTNIDYTDGRNAARLAVEMNGTQIEIGSLQTRNLIPEKTCESLYGHYSVVDYNACPESDDVWRLFGAKALRDMSGVNTCATRFSIALNRTGYRLKDQAGANFVGPKGYDWDLSIMNPDPKAFQTMGEHVIFAADSVGEYLTKTWGAPDYTKYSVYKKEGCPFDTGKDDIIVFQYPFGTAYADAGHVGLGSKPKDFQEGHFVSDCDNVNIWIIRRQTWNLKK